MKLCLRCFKMILHLFPIIPTAEYKAQGTLSPVYDLTLKAYHDQTKRNQAWRMKMLKVGRSVDGNQFYSSISYEEGDGVNGGCLDKKTDCHFHSLPNYPHCYLVSGVVNFFLACTDSVKRV
ncbi:unnamed protein product [Boreogadus saida]